jgi:hypothetical protein
MGGDNTDAGGRGSGGVAGGWSIGTIGRLTQHFPKKIEVCASMLFH